LFELTSIEEAKGAFETRVQPCGVVVGRCGCRVEGEDEGRAGRVHRPRDAAEVATQQRGPRRQLVHGRRLQVREHLHVVAQSTAETKQKPTLFHFDDLANNFFEHFDTPVDFKTLAS